MKAADERRADLSGARRLVARGLRARRDRLEDRRSGSQRDAFDEKDASGRYRRDRELLYGVLEREVAAVYADRARWLAIMAGKHRPWRSGGSRRTAGRGLCRAGVPPAAGTEPRTG